MAGTPSGYVAPKWQRLYAIPGMLLFGSLAVVIQKFLFEYDAQGSEKYGYHKFRKPWFQSDTMFMGMTLSLLAYHLLGEKQEEKEEAEGDGETGPSWKIYLASAVPALCDLTATSLMNVQLLYLKASVFQMFRGGGVIFSAIFSVLFLKRKHYAYMWWALIGIAVALGVVGVAAVMSTGISVDDVPQSRVILAMELIFVAQLVQAGQLVFEDFVMHNLKAHPLQLVGLKGFWGFIFCTSIAFPVVQHMPGTEGNGVHEDIYDTFTMLGNSTILLVFAILYIFLILGYNIGGMLVINVFSAVHRTILEGVRTACVWVAQLILYYSIKGTAFGDKHPTLGENWNRFCFMQLSGFLLLFTCTLMYNKIITLPFFNYHEEPSEDQVALYSEINTVDSQSQA